MKGVVEDMEATVYRDKKKEKTHIWAGDRGWARGG